MYSPKLLPQDVIVVDDGSTDNTKDVLKPFRRRIHYIRQENQGPAVARNCGIAEAKGDVLAFLDADDVWLPEKLDKQVNVLTENPRIGLVHSHYDYLDMASGGRLTPRPEMGGFLATVTCSFSGGAASNSDGSPVQGVFDEGRWI